MENPQVENKWLSPEPTTEAFASFDSLGKIIEWSHSAEELFGWSKELAVGKEIISLIFPEELRAKQFSEINYFLATQESDTFGKVQDLMLLTREGRFIQTKTRITPENTGGDKFIFHIFVLPWVQESDSAAVAGAHDAMLSIDTERKITVWNAAAERIYMYTSEEAIGKKIEMLMPSDIATKNIVDYVKESIRDQKSFHSLELAQRTKDGGVINLLINLNPVLDQQGVVTGVVIAAKDLSEQKQIEDKLLRLKDHDVLTDLPNRFGFAKSVNKILSVPNTKGSLVIIDIDHFKLINDSYGHDIGDSLIKSVATVLRDYLLNSEFARDNSLTPDMIAHFGGDEFIFLMPNKSLEEASVLTNTLIDKIVAYTHKKHSINLSISAGIAYYDSEKDQNAETLIIAADTALFEAKESGRGKTILYDTSHTNRLDWAEKLRKALDEGNLVLYQQPIQNIRTGEIERCELLLRMKIGDEVHPPTPFLETADRLGLIGEVDLFVVQKGIELAAQGHVVEINLSAGALNNRKLLQQINDLLKETKCNPENVIFEITETSAVANFVEATELITELTQLGCRFSLDDFGTGFGSFLYLKHLPVSGIKIDGDFVRNISNSEVDQKIVEAIVMIAKALKKETVAEWVGDQATLELLEKLQVDYAQGYLIGKPELIDNLPSVLQKD